MNLRLRQVSWDVLDLSISQNNLELSSLDSTAIEQKRNQKVMSSSLDLQHQNVSQHLDPKSVPRFVLFYAFYIVFYGWLVCFFFNLPYKVIHLVKAGLKYSLFLCAPSPLHPEIMFHSRSAFTQCSSQVLLSGLLYS